MLTQVKIVLTLPNLVYKGNETNSVNSGQDSVNSSEPSFTREVIQIVLTNPFYLKEK